MSAAAWVIVAGWVVIALLLIAAVRLRRTAAALHAAPALPIVAARLYDPVEPFTIGGLTVGGERARPALLVAGLEDAVAEVGDLDVDIVKVAGEELPQALQPRIRPAVVGIAREGAVCVLGSPRDARDLREAAQAAAGAMLAGAPGSQRRLAWGASAPFWVAP